MTRGEKRFYIAFIDDNLKDTRVNLFEEQRWNQRGFIDDNLKDTRVYRFHEQILNQRFSQNRKWRLRTKWTKS